MRIRFTYRLILAVILLSGSMLSAQRFSFQRYGEPDGLLDLVITDLIQDHDGYIWAATFSGVYRYDGTSFQRFGEADGIPSSTGLSFLETPDGTLWVISDHSLIRFEGNRFRNFELGIHLNGSQSAAWLEKSGTFALATNSGLASIALQGSGLAPIKFDPRSKGQTVMSLYAAPDDNLWYSVADEVCRKSGSKTDCFGPHQGVPKENWTAIRMDRKGDLWIRSEKNIRRLPAKSSQFESIAGKLPPTDGTGLLNLDREGNIFVPTQKGLARLNKGQWQFVGMHQGMTSDSVRVALEDREGSLWVGHLGAGLERWRGYDTWEGWTELEGLSNSSILAIQPVTADHLYLGTDRGLIDFKIGQGAIRSWLEGDGLAGDHVLALALDSSGDLWIGSSPGGLSRLNHLTGRVERMFNMGPDGVLGIAIDGDGAIWAATSLGLQRFERDGNHVRLTTPPESPKAYVPQLMRDRSGHICAVSSGNLYTFDNQRWTIVSGIDGLTPGTVFNMAEDRNGNKVVLTFSGKLFQLFEQDGRWVAKKLPDLSAPGSVVPYFLRSDRNGTLWVGTDRGVFALEASSREWRWYTEDDGLVWNDINLGAFHEGIDNDVWIGTSRGLAHYIPNKFQINRPTPRAKIVSLAVNGRTLEGRGPFTSSYPASSVQLNVTALTFTNEERNRFLYRRRGIDAEWIVTSSHQIVYSDLRPGEYIFEVLAQSPDGRVSNEPAIVILTVRPIWYMTSAFWILSTAGVVVLLVIAFRWRTRSYYLRQKELETAVAERTNELEVERRFERDQALIMEKIVSDTRLDEILSSIAEMAKTYSPGFECSIFRADTPLENPETTLCSSEIFSTGGELIGWMVFKNLIGNSEIVPASKVVPVAMRLAAVAIETRGAYEKLDHQANHDLLTGLPNRLSFQDGIQKAYQEANSNHESFAVIYIDLDRFKEVNDRYGHRIGDLFLQELSNRFRGCMRKGDLLARLGGDEFAAILPGATSPSVVQRVVRTLEASLAMPVLLPGCTIQGAASFGFSMYPIDAEDIESLLRSADQAMYRAKQKRKNALQVVAS